MDDEDQEELDDKSNGFPFKATDRQLGRLLRCCGVHCSMPEALVLSCAINNLHGALVIAQHQLDQIEQWLKGHRADIMKAMAESLKRSLDEANSRELRRQVCDVRLVLGGGTCFISFDGSSCLDEVKRFFMEVKRVYHHDAIKKISLSNKRDKTCWTWEASGESKDR